MKRISKCDFCNILAESESMFMGVTRRLPHIAEFVELYNFATNNGMDFSDSRTVVYKGTTVLKFNDGSALSIDQERQRFITLDGVHIYARAIDREDGTTQYVWYWIV